MYEFFCGKVNCDCSIKACQCQTAIILGSLHCEEMNHRVTFPSCGAFSENYKNTDHISAVFLEKCWVCSILSIRFFGMVLIIKSAMQNIRSSNTPQLHTAVSRQDPKRFNMSQAGRRTWPSWFVCANTGVTWWEWKITGVWPSNVVAEHQQLNKWHDLENMHAHIHIGVCSRDKNMRAWRTQMWRRVGREVILSWYFGWRWNSLGWHVGGGGWEKTLGGVNQLHWFKQWEVPGWTVDWIQ